MSNSISGQSVARFADIEILRYEITDFDHLPLERKLLVYHLSEAALAGRDIIWDQHSAYGLRIRHILETIYIHYRGERSTPQWQALEEYLQRVWFASGIHHHYGCDKFEPGFDKAYLLALVHELQTQCLLLEYGPDELDDICEEIMEPSRSPKLTEQSDTVDVVRASSVNFYDAGTTQEQVEHLYRTLTSHSEGDDKAMPPSYGLNTRIGRTDDGQIYEQTYAIGQLYGKALERICTHLKAALAYTDTEAQREALLALIDYYKTGDLRHYNRFCIIWVGDTETTVDFINGFTETYSDPLGLKGSWEGLVHLRHQEASQRTAKICSEAAWFEAHAPIAPAFRKEAPVGVSASVVTVAMLAGDSYPASPLGINLPNANWIRETHGSKSVTIDNIHQAYRLASTKNGMDELFVPDEATRQMLWRYEPYTDTLHTDLHECLGHGSGRLLPGVTDDALGPYGATIEEARADLFALYYMADEKLLEMELLPDREAYKACYYRYVLNGAVTQLVRIRHGHSIEEAHMRNRALIARYVLDHGRHDGSIELRGLELVIHDYARLRQHFASLLGEIQRIKSEGDLEAARTLVEQYAIRIDSEMHAEILARYATLRIAPYRGFVNPRLELVWDEGGIVDVRADYTEGYVEQMLRYSAEYSTLGLAPVSEERLRLPHPSQATLALAKELRAGLRTSMDGVVSSSMREKGLHYGINFGLTMDYIQRRASQLPPSADLARYLLSRDVRELKLIGQMIYPIDAIDFATATTLASQSFSNPELRDCLCKHTFDRVPHAPLWALAWLVGEGYSDLHAIAYTTLARHITQGYRLEHEAQRTRLFELAIATLSSYDSPYITAPQRGALLLLKRWLRADEAIAQLLRLLESLALWQIGDSPIHQEFAQDLLFELDFE